MTTSHTHAGNMVNASNKVTSTIVMVDAATAARWLTKNKRNRPISESVVKRYQADMEAGLWQFAGDPIRFDMHGNLIDGQHRLTALSRTEGITLPMLVVRGLPADSQLVMDQGRKRTPGQQLALLGVKYAASVASSVKVFLIWKNGLLFKDAKSHGAITSPVIQEWVEMNTEQVVFMQDLMTSIRAIEAPPAVLGAFVIGGCEHNPDLTRVFITQLAEMTGLEKGDPIHTLDRRLRNIRRKKENLVTRDYLALFIQAFNAWADGRTLTQLPRPAGGIWTEDRFPVLDAA